jgi:hypothetical protein
MVKALSSMTSGRSAGSAVAAGSRSPLQSFRIPRTVGWTIALVTVAGVAAIVRLTAAPVPEHARSTAASPKSSPTLSQESIDRDAARTICGLAVARMIGEPAADQLAVRSTFPVQAIEPGVLSVKVGMRDAAAPATSRRSFSCQATNQRGTWEAEAVSEIHE